MIESRAFVEAGRAMGFSCYTGVPCSFLTPFINYVIDDRQLLYLPAANEGDALAAAAGMTLGGRRAVVMLQNSGLGNAINPLTSLTHTFRIPVLLICTLRGDPELRDEPQHELMGRITGELLRSMEIPWEYFPREAATLGPALRRADAWMNEARRPFAFILRKNSVSPHPARAPGTKPPSQRTPAAPDYGNPRRGGGAQPSREQALRRILGLCRAPRDVLITATGYTGRELYSLADRPAHFYMVGSMGCASSLGLGLALVRPELRVVVIDGDGALLMRMGNLAVTGARAGGNLVHLLLDNEQHDSTGGQATVSKSVDFAAVATACGYAAAWAGADLDALEAPLRSEARGGPLFAHLKIRTGTRAKLPRPRLNPEDTAARFTRYCAAPNARPVS